MMDSELKKTSVRANTLEKKRFEMLLASFDSAKRNVAVDIKKAQLDFRRRLKRYKDRQREILETRTEPSSSTMDEFVLKQLRRRSHMSHSSRTQQHGLRPQTSPHPQGSLSFSSGSDGHGTGTGTGTNGSAAMVNSSLGSADYEEDENLAKLSHCRRSKVDLRPCTAWSVMRNSSDGGKPNASGASRSNSDGVRLLHLRDGGLGTPARQVRYLDDEEIEERCAFYRILLDGYRLIEQQRHETLNGRVDEFCGKASSRLPSCPPPEKVGVGSLPAGVPPIIHQAMKVKVHPLSFTGNMQRAKTQ